MSSFVDLPLVLQEDIVRRLTDPHACTGADCADVLRLAACCTWTHGNLRHSMDDGITKLYVWRRHGHPDPAGWVRSLCQLLARLRRLECLHVRDSDLSSQEAAAIASVLADAPALRTLVLDDNRIARITPCLGLALAELKQLRRLDLHGNRLASAGAVALQPLLAHAEVYGIEANKRERSEGKRLTTLWAATPDAITVEQVQRLRQLCKLEWGKKLDLERTMAELLLRV